MEIVQKQVAETGTPRTAERGFKPTADPWKDTDVIDARAPRFNQTVVAVVTIIGLMTGWWWLIGLMGLQLIVGLVFGREYCITCVVYFKVIQPRFGEGEIEDARPPRFANILGAVFLSSSAIALATGLTVLGTVLGGMVAVLATLAATTGLCVGCEIYRLIARVRGVRPGKVDHVDLDELGARPAGEIVIQFTHPLCTGCRTLSERFAREGRDLVLVDIAQRPDLARKYHVSIVPTALQVDGGGRVLARLA